MEGLERFREAQQREADGLEAALAEVEGGRKRGHWIWYVFPQLAGLGSSEMSQRYGVRGREEAHAYLRDEELRANLARAIGAVADRLCLLQPPRLEDLMGSRVDALKLVSSLTLFEIAATELHETAPDEGFGPLAESAGEVLAVAEAQGYERCAYTTAQLATAA